MTQGTGLVLADRRNEGRALRATWHRDLNCVVLSVWRGPMCVGTVQLAPADATLLAATLDGGLAATA